VEVRVELVRPGQDQGDVLALIPTRPGEYQGQLPPLSAGSWVARLLLAHQDEKIVLEHTLEVQ
jgi:hypothetical protein